MQFDTLTRTGSAAAATLLLALGGFSLALTGCEQQGPAERAGENIDDAVEDAGDRMEDAGDRIEDAFDR